MTGLTARHGLGRRGVLLALIAGSVLVRVLYFQELSSGPCVWQHHWTESDMFLFDRWARTIAAGDWLTDRPLHPHTRWHRAITEPYLAEHPEAMAAVTDLESTATPSAPPWELLWDHWYGGKCFHQEPLYPYLVALTYGALGSDVRWVFAWQLAIGVLTNVLVYVVARRHFGDAVAALAGCLALLCGPLLFYEMILLRESLIVFAGMALVFLVDRAMERGRWQPWLLAGAAFGLAILLKATFALLLLGVLGWMVSHVRWSDGAERRALVRNGVAVVGGAALCLAPAVARNLAVGAPATCLSGVGPVTFLCANAEDYAPDEGFKISTHTAEIMGKADGAMLPVVRETLATHDGPGSYLRQLAGKFALVWHWYETPNNENFYYYRLQAPVLWFLPVTFALIAPLSAVGLMLAAPAFRQHVAPYLLVLTTIAQLLLFYVVSRLRIPLAPALLPFAALTVVRVGEWLRAGRWLAAAAAAGAVVLVACVTLRPLPPEREAIRLADWVVPFQVYWEPAEHAAVARRDWRTAADVLADATAEEPDVARAIRPSGVARTPEEEMVATFFGRVHARCAAYLLAAGEPGPAAREHRRARALRSMVQSH